MCAQLDGRYHHTLGANAREWHDLGTDEGAHAKEGDGALITFGTATPMIETGSIHGGRSLLPDAVTAVKGHKFIVKKQIDVT